MIKSIKIQNYKLFKNFEVDNLSKILLIGGENNCGKTTLLESLFMSLDCGNPLMFMRHLGWRGLSSFNNNAEAVFAPAFYNFNLENSITFEYFINSSKKRLSYKFHPMIAQAVAVQNKKIELQATKDNELGRVEISYGTGKSKPINQAFLKLETQGLSLTNTQFLLKYIEGVKAVFLSSVSQFPPQENSQRYGELDRTNQTEEILKTLQILEPNLKSLSLIPMGGNPTIYGDTGIGVKIPIPLMGQGMNRLLSILLAISEVKKGIVLIDEMENGFHQSVLPYIWKAISRYAQANKTQIVATTHSRELVSSAVVGIPEDLREDFKYIRIERENNNEFSIKNYHFEKVETALEARLEIR